MCLYKRYSWVVVVFFTVICYNIFHQPLCFTQSHLRFLCSKNSASRIGPAQLDKHQAIRHTFYEASLKTFKTRRRGFSTTLSLLMLPRTGCYHVVVFPIVPLLQLQALHRYILLSPLRILCFFDRPSYILVFTPTFTLVS